MIHVHYHHIDLSGQYMKQSAKKAKPFI